MAESMNNIEMFEVESPTKDKGEKFKNLIDSRIDSDAFGNFLSAIDSGNLPRFVEILSCLKKDLAQDTISLNKSLYHGVTAENVFIVQQLIFLGAKVARLPGKRHNCLHVAAKQGSFSITELLLETQSDLVNDVDETGNTALHLCQSSTDAYHITKLLLSANADRNVQNNEGETALIKAVKRCNIGVVKLLVEAGANIELTDRMGNSAQSLCVAVGLENLLSIFVENSSAYDEEDRTPLMKALTYENLHLFRTIIASKVVDVNEEVNNTNSCGENVLQIYLNRKINALTESYPDIDFWTCKTSFDWFSDRDKEVISLLVNAGAKIVTSSCDDSALDTAIILGSTAIVQCILKGFKNSKSNFDDRFMFSAVERAVTKCRCDLVILLIDTWIECGGTRYSDCHPDLGFVLLDAIDKHLKGSILKILEN